MVAWSAAMAACFLGGVIEFVGGIVGPWMKKRIPRAALLGTVAGIGFIWMATEGVFDIFQDPILGLPVMIVAMLGVFGVYAFPKKDPASCSGDRWRHRVCVLSGTDPSGFQ